MKIIFWLSILTIIYVYIGYPLIIFLLSIFYKLPVRRTYPYPTVSIIMAVYNEEKNIESKIKTLLELDYPTSRMEILIGSDGSNDKTDQILSKYINPGRKEFSNDVNERIKLHTLPSRSGKPTMLNLLVKEAKGEILVFTDARQILDKSSVDELVKNFADPKVGAVSAELYFEDQNNKTANGVGLYWRYEKFIRERESKIGSMTGVTGALYAIRKELWTTLPKDLILDDVYIPLKIIHQGYRVIFDKKAKIYDRYSKNPKEEFLRKSRTLAGNFQLLLYFNWLMNPFKNLINWQFISHKFLRLLVPFLLIFIFVINFFLLTDNFYRATLILQSVFYLLAVIGAVIKYPNPLLNVPQMFCVMNTAAVVGLYRFLRNKQGVLWERIEN